MYTHKKTILIMTSTLAIYLSGCAEFAAQNPVLAGASAGAWSGAGAGAALAWAEGENPLKGAMNGAVTGVVAGGTAGYVCRLSQEFLANHQTEEIYGYKSLKERLHYHPEQGLALQVEDLQVIPDAILNPQTGMKNINIATQYYVMTPSENEKMPVKEIWFLEKQDAQGQYQRDPQDGFVKPIIMKPGERRTTTSLSLAPGLYKLTMELHYNNYMQRSSAREFSV